MEEYMLFRLMMAGSATGLFVLATSMYRELRVIMNAHHEKKN